MAAKGLVRHLLLSEDFRHVERNILDYITAWDVEDAYDVDYLESLDIIASHILQMNNTDENDYQIFLQKVITNICVPLLRFPRPTTYDQDKGNKLKVLQLTYKLVTKITLGTTSLAISQFVWSLIIETLTNFTHECRHGFGEGHEIDSTNQVFEIATALDLLGSLLDSMNCWDNEREKLDKLGLLQCDIEKCIFEAVLDVILVIRNAGLLYKMTGKVLPKLLGMVGETKLLQNTKKIWEAVKRLSLQEMDEHQGPSSFFGSYAIMSSLTDMFFAPNLKSVFQVHHDPVFWTMLQKGLVNMDSLVRKQCLFLLQKAVEMCRMNSEKVYLDKSSSVFWWDPVITDGLSKTWQQYVFLLETLEEKQLHVIKPVLIRLVELIDAAKKPTDSQFTLLHVSWLTVLVHRAAIHENRFIKKWGIMSLMTLDLHEIPLLENASTRRFISDTLIMLLKEPSLYAKNDGETKREPSKLSKELTGFFKRCFELLHDDLKKEFVNQMLTSIHEYKPSHVPLTFICQGLANLPRHPVFGEELLTNLRLVLPTMTSHSVALRGAVQTFLLRSFMNLLDPSSVNLDDVFMFLAMFPREESLSRETLLWKEVGQWLSDNVMSCSRASKDLLSFLVGKVQILLSDSDLKNNRSHAVRLAKFILLCHDSLVISPNQTIQLFDSIFFIINKTQSNPYYPISNCWQAVELLRALLHELQSTVSLERAVSDNIIRILSSRLHDVLHVLMHCHLRSVEQDSESTVFNGYRICFQFLVELKYLWTTHIFPDAISRLYQPLIRKLAETGLRSFCAQSQTKPTTTKGWLDLVVAVKWMVWIVEFADVLKVPLGTELRNRFYESIQSWDLVSDLRYPKCNQESDLAFQQEDWRILAEDFISGQWTCVNMVLTNKALVHKLTSSTKCSLVDSTECEILSACAEALSLVSRQAVFPCLQTLQLLLPKLVASDDEASSVHLLQTAWSVLNEIRTRYSAQFWPALGILVKIIFAAELLVLPADHPLTALVSHYWKSLLAIAHDQSGLVSVAVEHICKVFSHDVSKNARMQGLVNHVEIIADTCVFGPVHKKDLKLLLDTAAHVRNMGENCSTACLANRKEFECEPTRVRVDILALLLNLDPSDHECTLFFVKLIESLLERNQTLSKAKTSRFLNSENHRQKQRLWQVILIVIRRLADTDFLQVFIVSVLQALQSDNQTSVRFLMEWALVCVFAKPGQDIELIVQELEDVYKKRLGYVASMITVVTHVFLALDESVSRQDYLFRILPLIVPCAFLNHSQIRAYILDALRLIRGVCPSGLWDEIIGRFPIVESCLAFANSVVEGEKEKGRLEKDRALFSLHPVDDWGIETIFATVPTIAGLVQGEVISLDDFRNEGSSPWIEVHDVPLCSKGMVQPENNQIRETISHVGSTKGGTIGVPGRTSEGKAVAPVDGDVQKKITPWQVAAPPREDLDVFDQLQQRHIQRRVGDLVVVASLIDRAPNLGGLCRTCEIFGASRLVLGSKQVIGEMGFKSVSVSSEKWVEVEEVKVHDLSTYINAMRKEGFTIVGVEQTARSKKLTDFQFPLNTVLVLGNEKAGIPVELIQLLDECVEIPQQGIIRSLNVHVSGALFIWEYSRQHVNDN